MDAGSLYVIFATENEKKPMIMSRLFISFCLFTFSLSCFAQQTSAVGSIQGTIRTKENKPLGSATILLRGTKKAVLSDNDGAFTFKIILPGNYTIEITSIGCHSLEIEVSV